MAETVIAVGRPIYPSNHGPNNSALARDHELYKRKAVKGANFVSEGAGLVYSASSLSVTLQSRVIFIDGREVDDGSASNTFTLPANETRYIMMDRAGRVFHRDTDNPTTDNDLVLWEVTTDGTGVVGTPVDRRRKNQFSEVGVDDNEFYYLSSDRTKTMRYNTATGRVEMVGDFAPTRILNLPDPALDQEAANKRYVDNSSKSAKSPVRVASTANIDLTTGGLLTIDGIATAADDRVLVKNQTTGSQNGIYLAKTGAWVRAADADTAAKFVAGFIVAVQEGTQEKSVWLFRTTGTITLGTTTLNFSYLTRTTELTSKTAAFTAEPDQKYFADHGTPANRIDVTLPASARCYVGTRVAILSGSNTGLARVIPNTSQTIKVFGSTSASGSSGYWQAVSIRSYIVLEYVATDTWQAIDLLGQWDNDASVRQGPTDSTKPLRATASAAASDAVVRSEVDTGGAFAPVKYATVDVAQAFANGQILAQGYANAEPSTMGATDGTGGWLFGAPGVIANPGTTTSVVYYGLLGTHENASTRVGGTFAPGTKYFVKGRYINFSDTPRASLFERFAIGVAYNTGPQPAGFGAEDEDARDNDKAVAVVVDDSENIKSYNCEAAGDASYTDSGFDADLSAGMYFEMIVEVPSTADNINDYIITIKVNGNIILNAVNPVASQTSDFYLFRPYILINQKAIVTDLIYKVEKVA